MAKLRQGFVTNSSSSSFIIARNNKCTSEEVINLIIEKLSDDIKRELEDEWQVKYLSDDIKIAVLQKDYDKAVRLIAQELYHRLTSYHQMKLGDWEVYAESFSNEDDFYSYLIYEYGYKLVSNNFKVE